MTIWHPLVDPDCKGATLESNLRDIEVIRGLLDGTERNDAINAMIKGNIPLVVLKVETYLKIHSGLKFLCNDMVSAGFIGLAEAVQILANLKTPGDKGNPTGFIGQRIIWAIGDLVQSEEKHRLPPDKQRVEGSVRDADNNDDTPYSPYTAAHDRLVTNPMAMVDLRDLLKTACKTPEDVIIMEMRARGSIDEEIAARLGISRKAVQIQRYELASRYDALVRDTQ